MGKVPDMPERYSTIAGIGSSLPDRVLDNDDLEEMVDTSDEWITSRTGIKERRIAEDGVGLSKFATEASRGALEMAGVDPRELELIICATVTPDQPLPATSCFVQDALGAVNASAFDLSAACSGFLYALTTADQFIKTGKHENILVIGGEVLSSFIDYQDRQTCVLFGDGAGAAVIQSSGETGLLSSSMHNDGSMKDYLSIPAGGSKMPASEETVKNKSHYVKMKGNETFKIAIRRMYDVSIETLEKADLDCDDLDLFIPHQANSRINGAVAKRLKLAEDRVYENIERVGNTSAGSIPIALREVIEKGIIKKGDHLLFTAFGGGLTWASVLMEWNL